jgi:hypothetical protein
VGIERGVRPESISVQPTRGEVNEPGKPFHELTALEKADRFLVFYASLACETRPGLSELEASAIKIFAAWADDHDHRSRSQREKEDFRQRDER